MAWTQQAYRFAVAGLPDPAQVLDEQQTHLALANVPAASDIAVFTPLAWPRRDGLAIHYIPDPAEGFTVITRSAIGYAPRIGESDSINRDGSVTATLADVSADLDGTITIPTVDGSFAVTLDDVTGAFAGTFAFRHFFDISYSVTPTWVVNEQPANFGDVTVTVGAVSASLTGFSLPPDSTQGRIEAVLEGATADLDGTFVVAPGRDGLISGSMNNALAGLSGSFVPSGGALGLITANVDGITADFDGTSASFSTDGAIARTIDEVVTSWQGQFIDASAINGRISSQVDSVSVAFSGTSVLPVGVAIVVEGVFDLEVNVLGVFELDDTIRGTF